MSTEKIVTAAAVKKTLTPLFDRVLIEPIMQKQVGAVVIPESIAKDHLTMARILIAGPGKLRADTNEFLATQVKPGEIVFINAYMGNRIKIPAGMDVYVQVGDEEVRLENGREYILQQEDCIIARLGDFAELKV